jgi:hypothetical protein
MASKLANPIDLNPNKKIPPIGDPTKRTLNKLKITDSLVAPVEKQPVPDHALNTSKN